MAITKRSMPLPPAAVFAALREGQRYADWVVGTRAIRDVDAGFPAPGTKLHYTVGYGPLRHDDETEVLVYRPDEALELSAKAWPAGTARIDVRVRPDGTGSIVEIDERPDAGLAARLHNPLFDLAIKVRNVESLRRLERVAREVSG